MLDTILLEVHDISKVYLVLLIKLFNSTKSFIYIPGKTLEEEKQRAVILQHGILPVLIHVLLNTKDEMVKEMIRRHVKEDYSFHDIQYTSKLLDHYLNITHKEGEMDEESKMMGNGKVVRKKDFGVNINKEARLDERFIQFEKRLRLANQVQRIIIHNNNFMLSK